MGMTDLNKVEVLIPSQPPSSIWTFRNSAECEVCQDDVELKKIGGAYIPNVCMKKFSFDSDNTGLCKKHLESATWLDERAVLRFFTEKSNGYPDKCVHCEDEDIEQVDHEWGEHWITVRFRCHKCFEDFEAQAEFSTWQIL